MLTHRRTTGALLTFVISAAATLVGLPAVTAAAAAGPVAPPSCAWNNPSLNCVHAPTPDIAALPAPSFTTSYIPKMHERTVTLQAAIVPPYPKCPDGGVPLQDLPCSFRGLSVSGRVYVPGATALGAGATSVPLNSPCDFSCTATFALGSDYHGPATIILKFAIGDLLQGQNDLTSSSYETTIRLPADPVAGTIHITKPRAAYSGKLKTMNLQLAGKGGIPKSGVGGVLVRLVTSGDAEVRGGDGFDNGIGELMAIPGTTLKVVKEAAGTATFTTLGWYAKAPTNTGDLVHTTSYGRKMRVAPTMALRSAGVPLDATSAIIAVVLPKGSASFDGVTDSLRGFGQYLLVPLKKGAKLSVKAPKGTKVWVYGYTEPMHVVDEGSTISTPYAQDLDNLLGLEQQDYIN